ncbi:helix-turn-helix domain-containing protein [Streptomyces sp. NPDC008150]|uniref:helix-turn-helix domain-containing protein n=1 Tax=Streptomyces sp. NPDC008150 TaxID=3364816 RepID=UPI0036E4730F
MSDGTAGQSTSAPGPEKPFIFTWHGREADALRLALRLTQDQIAEQLGCSTRTVTRWREANRGRISVPIQEALDAMYERLTVPQVRRFLHALKQSEPREVSSPVVMAAEMTLMQARIDELQQLLDSKEARP